MIERPLDLLNESKDSTVLVFCKGNQRYTGKLLAFDIHINIVLENMKELDHAGQIIKSYGLSFIRGDNINFISPGEK